MAAFEIQVRIEFQGEPSIEQVRELAVAMLRDAGQRFADHGATAYVYVVKPEAT